MSKFSNMNGHELFEDWQKFNQEIRNDPKKRREYLTVWIPCDQLVLDNEKIFEAWMSRVYESSYTFKAKDIGWVMQGDMNNILVPEWMVGKIFIKMPGWNILEFYVRELEEL